MASRSVLLLLISAHLLQTIPISGKDVGDSIRSVSDTAAVIKAGNKQESKFRRGIKKLLHHITAIDTLYIEPNKYNIQTMLLGEKRFSYLRLKASDDTGGSQALYFYPESPFKVGPYVGYSLFFLGYTFDVGHKQSSFNRSNIYVSLYSSMFGLDYYFESGADNYKILRVTGFGEAKNAKARNVGFSGMSTYFRNFHFYYLFNHKRFSYPAAYGQSTVQLRSAGSFILGFNYTHEKVHFDYTRLPSYLLYNTDGTQLIGEGLKVSLVQYRDYSLSLGYSYNWVFARHWLANLTLAPTIGYNFSKGERFNTKEKLFNLDQLNFDFISRSSLVWNNSHFFAGMSFVGHTYTYRKPSFSVQNAFITANVYVGMNFLRKDKKKKRKQQ